MAAVPAHALGHPGARGDAGPRHGRSTRRQSEMAVHQRIRGRRLPRRPRRRAADPARCRASCDGLARHRRCVRRRRDRWARQHHGRLRCRRAGLGAQCLRHPDLPENLHHPGLCRHGGRADRAAMGPVRQARGCGAAYAGADGQSLAAPDIAGAARGNGAASRWPRPCHWPSAITRSRSARKSRSS